MHSDNKGLWEMLLTYARAFATTVASIEFCRGQIHGLMMADQFGFIDEESPIGASTIEALRVIGELCADIPSLTPVCFQIERISNKIKAGSAPLVLHTDLENLNHRILDELREHFYMPITEANAALYSNESPCGPEVFAAFPSARFDIQSAVQCLILGQPTAAVFHAMRVMEVALKVLGRRLRIQYAPSWESYLRQITSKVDEPHKSKTQQWKIMQPIYIDLCGDLTSIKFAWRNTTMHIVRNYNYQEASTILTAVNGFLVRLAANGFKETGKPVATRVAPVAA